ncbi:hypothetical protein [Garciella nitratireducens]|uniref:hypothetical protein n=1 Tax=Garciella nitratireducens TaxID=218205 RepID=UPI001BD32FFC|nr:hypothetical protein [Garciella nitratireducens]
MDINDIKKKRLLYDKSEDIYFSIYNILLLLNYLGCVNEDKAFKDYRKLTFLIPLISDEVLNTIFIDYYRGKSEINKNIRRRLDKIYNGGIENIPFIRYILLILEESNFIKLIGEENKVNLYLCQQSNLENFLGNTIFADEIKCINNIKIGNYQIAKVSYSTFINNLFKVNGVSVWEE